MSKKGSLKWKEVPDNLKDRVVADGAVWTHTFRAVKPPIPTYASGNIIFDINPIPAPRMVRSDKWKKRPIVERCFAWRNEIRAMCQQNGYKLDDTLVAVFVIQMPKSWSEKKKQEMDGKPHKQRPDLDNLEKNFCDTLLSEDGCVYRHLTEKVWGRKGQIIINS